MKQSLDTARIGEIGMHIFSFDEMSRENWMDFFGNVEEVEYALEDPENWMARAQADSETIASFLRARKDQLQGIIPVSPVSTDQVQQVQVAQQGVPRNQESQPVASPVQQNITHVQGTSTVVLKNRIETIITDKGVYFHVDSLQERLSSFTTDKNLFMLACAEAGVDIFTEYVSEAAKKKIAKAVQVLIKEGV